MGLFNPISLSSFTPTPSCISVSPNSFALSSPGSSSALAPAPSVSDKESSSPLVLIGRSDGSVDLFVLETGEILSTWSDLSLYHPSSSASLSSASAIVYAAWVAWHSPSFLLIDSLGFLFYFDLFQDSSKPLFVENLSLSTSVPSSVLLPNLVSLSLCRSVGGMVHLALAEVEQTVGSHGLKVRKVSDELVWASPPLLSRDRDRERGEGKEGKEREEESKASAGGARGGALSCGSSFSSSSWMGRVTGSNVVLEYRSTASSSHGNGRGAGGRK
jgi:hypothetical protein